MQDHPKYIAFRDINSAVRLYQGTVQYWLITLIINYLSKYYILILCYMRFLFVFLLKISTLLAFLYEFLFIFAFGKMAYKNYKMG